MDALPIYSITTDPIGQQTLSYLAAIINLGDLEQSFHSPIGAYTPLFGYTCCTSTESMPNHFPCQVVQVAGYQILHDITCTTIKPPSNKRIKQPCLV